MYQPAGFRTSYRSRDFDDIGEGMGTVGFPQLAMPPGRRRANRRWDDDRAERRPVPVLRINDNDGALFPLARAARRSAVVLRRVLVRPTVEVPVLDGATRSAAAAIGEVRPTDVVAFSLDNVALHAGILPTSRRLLPAGIPAMWSFAEVFRRGCQVALDLQPDELQVGLQPIRVHDFETRRVFLADRLENGAGYAPELSEERHIKAILGSIVTGCAADAYESPAHADCTEACPDCLRSWDNRRLHGALDWRLALDVAGLADGQALETGRWLGRSATLAENFVAAYGEAIPCHIEEAGELLAIVADGGARAVLLGHPLWLHDKSFFNSAQADAYDVLSS